MKTEDIDSYIKNIPADSQEKVKEIRKIIREEIPNGEEVISYQIPCFKLNGKYIVYFSGWRNHVSLYPIPKGNAEFRKEIQPFVKGKGTVQFPLDKPLPVSLIRKFVNFHIKERSAK